MKKQNKNLLDEIKQIRDEMLQSLSVMARPHGYTVKTGAVSYTEDGNFEIKVVWVKNGAASPEEKHYDLNRATFNLPPYGSPVTINGKTYTIAGLNATGSKVILRSDGKKFSCPRQAITSQTEYHI